VAHLYFFHPHKAKQKNPKEPPSQRTKTVVKWTDTATTEEEALLVTAPTQKAGFRASQTHLWYPKV